MKIIHFLPKYAILAAILNFRTLAVSNVIGGQIFWQICVLHQIWQWKQPVLFQICEKISDMPNPSYETYDAPYSGTCNYIAITIHSGTWDQLLMHFLINQTWKWRKKHASYTRTLRTYEHYTKNPLSQESSCEKSLAMRGECSNN